MLDRAAIPVTIHGLRGFAITTVQKLFCRRDAGRWRLLAAEHDANQRLNRVACVSSREVANVPNDLRTTAGVARFTPFERAADSR
jgi:hypothetical protein